MRKGVLDLVLTNQEALVEDVKVGDSIGCSEHYKLRILHWESKTGSRIRTLDLQSANFDLFKDLLGGI